MSLRNYFFYLSSLPLFGRIFILMILIFCALYSRCAFSQVGDLCPDEVFPWPSAYPDGSLCIPVVNVPINEQEHISYYSYWTPGRDAGGAEVLNLSQVRQYDLKIPNVNSIAEPVIFNAATNLVVIYLPRQNWKTEVYKVLFTNPLSIKKYSATDDFLEELRGLIGVD